MKKKKFFFIVGIIIFISLGFFVFFRSQDQNELDPALRDLPPVDQPASATDSGSSSSSSLTTAIIGVLIGDGNPWMIVYDDVATGAPAANFELVFNDQSRCDFGQGDTSCTPMYFEVGTSIDVKGYKNGKQLTVINLKKAGIESAP